MTSVLGRTAGRRASVTSRSDVGTPPAPGGPITLATAVGLLLAVLGFLIGSRAISDNSILTHVANGRMMWQGAGIPRVDPYSYSAVGEPVTVQSWLASWLYVAGQEVLGDWTLRVMNGLLGAAIVASLWRLADSCRQLLPRVGLVGAAVIVGAEVWTPRPLLFGLLGFALVLHALRHDIPQWVLVPTMWIWVQTHGSFPIALVLVAVVGLGHFIDTVAVRPDWWRSISSIWAARPGHELSVFGWVTAGILLGGLNPLGPSLLWFPVQLLSRSEALEDVREWMAPRFESPSEWAFVGMALLLIVAARRGARWRCLVPAIVFVMAALMAYRNLPLTVAVLVWALAPSFAETNFSIDAKMRGMLPNAVFGASLLLGVVVATSAVVEGTYDLRTYPVAEVDWLAERDLVAQPDVNIMQKDTVGNYLELRFGDRARVFVDDRFDFYPLDVLDDHDVMIFGGDYRDVLDRNEVNIVLWQAGGGLEAWLDDAPEWVIVEVDPGGSSDDAVSADGNEPVTEWLVACRVESSIADRCLASP